MKENKTVLVVDDEVAFQDMIQSYLKERGFKVRCADGAKAAVKAMDRDHMKVVILDYQMPKINGDDLIGKLQHINPGARFIIVSGMNDCDVERKFKGLGFFAYMNKGSLALEKLESTINQAFDE